MKIYFDDRATDNNIDHNISYRLMLSATNWGILVQKNWRSTQVSESWQNLMHFKASLAPDLKPH